MQRRCRALWFHRSVTAQISPTRPQSDRAHPEGARTDRARGAVSHADALIDLDAIAANAQVLRAAAAPAALMAVVKADGYGHGAVPVARAALAGGADMLGVATLPEAVAMRGAGITAPLAAWLWTPVEDVRPAVAAGVQIGISSLDHLGRVIAAAQNAPRGNDTAGGRVPIHLKVDTGLGRNGVMPADLAPLLDAVAAAERAGTVEMCGIMSHLACADAPDDPSVALQVAAFTDAITAAEAVGLTPRWRHLGNTAVALAIPSARFNLVRCGIGLYGLSPFADSTPTDLGGPVGRAAAADPDPARRLRPAMSLRARVALTKRVPAGQGVGYGLTYRAAAESTLALVPLGYGDGIPRCAGNVGQVWIGGRRRTIAGRVAMDQVVVDCGDDAVHAGDEVLIFGPGDEGEPTADDWASYCGTINYEIVTRIAPRVPRHYVGMAGLSPLAPERAR